MGVVNFPCPNVFTAVTLPWPSSEITNSDNDDGKVSQFVLHLSYFRKTGTHFGYESILPDNTFDRYGPDVGYRTEEDDISYQIFRYLWSGGPFY